MTTLHKPVRRTANLGERRPIVVTLDPNHGEPLLILRESGRRTGYSLPLAWCFVQAARKAADQKRASRKRGAR